MAIHNVICYLCFPYILVINAKLSFLSILTWSTTHSTAFQRDWNAFWSFLKKISNGPLRQQIQKWLHKLRAGRGGILYRRYELQEIYKYVPLVRIIMTLTVGTKRVQLGCSKHQPLQFSSVQDGIYALVKAHMRSTPSLKSFPSVVTLERVPMLVWLTLALSRPLKGDRWALPLSTPLSSRRPQFQDVLSPTSRQIDNCFFTPSQPQRSYQGETSVIKQQDGLGQRLLSLVDAS